MTPMLRKIDRDVKRFRQIVRGVIKKEFRKYLTQGELIGRQGKHIVSIPLPQVEILMPTKKPRGQELTLEQKLANQALHHRRLRIEHVNSSVKRCRIVKDRIRLWKQGVRDLVMELCCALHNFRVRLNPWQPMV